MAIKCQGGLLLLFVIGLFCLSVITTAANAQEIIQQDSSTIIDALAGTELFDSSITNIFVNKNSTTVDVDTINAKLDEHITKHDDDKYNDVLENNNDNQQQENNVDNNVNTNNNNNHSNNKVG
eukprot:UN09958